VNVKDINQIGNAHII